MKLTKRQWVAAQFKDLPEERFMDMVDLLHLKGDKMYEEYLMEKEEEILEAKKLLLKDFIVNKQGEYTIYVKKYPPFNVML